MSTTPNLAIEHILQSQAQKEVTANEAFGALDEAMNDATTIDVSAGNTTVSAADFTRNVLLILTGTPAGAPDLTVPASKRLFIVQNDCGQDVAVTAGAGALILTAGQRRLLYGDGTNVIAVAPDFASTGGGSGGGGGGFPVFKGALIKRTTNVTIASNTLTILGWESEVYDTDGFADVVAHPTRLTIPSRGMRPSSEVFWDAGNPTRLTVPSGVKRVRLLSNSRWQSSATGERQMLITRNGAALQGQPMARHGAAGLIGQNLASPALAVSEGDVFELSVSQSAGASLNVEAHSQTWFAIEVIE